MNFSVQPALLRWSDLDPIEQKCLRQVHNGNIRRKRTTKQQARARGCLETLGLIEMRDRRFYVTPKGLWLLEECQKEESR